MMTCCGPVIENHAGGKSFFVCTECKKEVLPDNGENLRNGPDKPEEVESPILKSMLGSGKYATIIPNCPPPKSAPQDGRVDPTSLLDADLYRDVVYLQVSEDEDLFRYVNGVWKRAMQAMADDCSKELFAQPTQMTKRRGATLGGKMWNKLGRKQW